MSGDESVWCDLVSILLAPHGHDENEIPVDKYEEDAKIGNKTADWVARCERIGFRSIEIQLVRTLKKGWYSEYLEMERREFALLADQKRSELMSAVDVWTRSQLSQELIDIYESIRDNLDTSAMHRSEEKKGVFVRLEAAGNDVEKMRQSCTISQTNAAERQSVIQKNSETTELEYRPKLQKIMERRIEIDNRISFLESEKRRLRLELEKVSNDLVSATNEQREAMIVEETIRGELRASRVKFESMLDTEYREESESRTDFEILSRCAVAIRNSKDRLSDLYTSSTSDLNDVCTQFDNAFTESVQDHVLILCETIEEIYRRVWKISDELENIKKSRNTHSMSQILRRPPASTVADDHEEFSASVEGYEVRISECESKLGLAVIEVEKFFSVFRAFFSRFETKITSNRLLKGQVDKVGIVYGEVEKMLQKHGVLTRIPPSAVTVKLQVDALPARRAEEFVISDDADEVEVVSYKRDGGWEI
jgi:hypothetical protein